MCFSSKKLIFFQKKHNARTLVLDIINDTEFSLNFSISDPGLKDTEPANRWRDSLLEGFGATRWDSFVNVPVIRITIVSPATLH